KLPRNECRCPRWEFTPSKTARWRARNFCRWLKRKSNERSGETRRELSLDCIAEADSIFSRTCLERRGQVVRRALSLSDKVYAGKSRCSSALERLRFFGAREAGSSKSWPIRGRWFLSLPGFLPLSFGLRCPSPGTPTVLPSNGVSHTELWF